MTPSYSTGPRKAFPGTEASCGDILYALQRSLSRRLAALLVFLRGNGLRMATNAGITIAWHIKRNLRRRRLLSFPHLMVLVWMLVLLRGERWIFHWKVDKCQWNKWEEWPSDANPHHLIFVADPQLIDPKSYPGRPWPLSDLTVLITDNYLRRGYHELQHQLSPDSLFFLGDLFDGGREWKTASGNFEDASWARPHPKGEREHLKTWKKYGNDYWLAEYERFSDIFFKPYYNHGTPGAHSDRSGRKLVASLPGNHDLGFGSMVKVPVRDRFTAFFGEPNRVDVVGNHTIVSVDTVSLSAGTSEQARTENLKHIFGPAEDFLRGVKDAKRKAIYDELRFWYGDGVESQFNHTVVDTDKISGSDLAPSVPYGDQVADFPTILLTHVPLYRAPGTPCGPLRERWPPSKPPPTDAVGNVVDNRNAISVTSGYQYQNVLSEADSVKLISSIGNVKRVFSGDDHDYCEIEHSAAKNGAVEITVKSLSMAMGVPTPGFVMLSMWNPVDEWGRPLRSPEATVQTHLCLLPNQFQTYFGYIYMVLVTLSLVGLRALLVSFLNLPPFAHSLDPSPLSPPTLLPLYNDDKKKRDDPEHYSSSSANSYPRGSQRASSSLAAPRTRAPATASLPRSPSPSPSIASTSSTSSKSKRKHSKAGQQWGWPGSGGFSKTPSGKPLRIHVYNDFYDSGKSRSLWRAAGGRRRSVDVRVVAREFGAEMWRVVWMVGLFWVYLNREG